MLRFFCSSCGTKVRAAESRAGDSVNCPQCGATTIVPGAPDHHLKAASPPREVGTTSSTGRRQREATFEKTAKIPLWAIVTGVAGLGLAIIVFGLIVVVLLLRSGGAAGPAVKGNDPPTIDAESKWIIGKWEGFVGTHRFDYGFHSLGICKFVESDQFGEIESADGKWFLRHGTLTTTVDVSFHRDIQMGTTSSAEIEGRTADSFTVKNIFDGSRLTLVRKR